MYKDDPLYGLIERNIIAYLNTFQHDWYPTGSTAFYGKGNDIDYIIDFNLLPAHIQIAMCQINVYAAKRYSDSFFLFKSKPFDYIVFKSTDYFNAWKYATETFKTLIEDRSFFNLMKDKEQRVIRFEKYKFDYFEQLSYNLTL